MSFIVSVLISNGAGDRARIYQTQVDMMPGDGAQVKSAVVSPGFSLSICTAAQLLDIEI